MAKESNLSKSIQEAIHQQVTLQNLHRKTFQAVEHVQATPEHLSKVGQLGWDGLLLKMQGLTYPPSSQEWKQWAGISEDQAPIKLGLDKVEDPLLRGQLCLLNSASDIAQQVGAMARFFGEIVGAKSPELEKVFYWWCQRTAAECMLAQCKAHGLTDKKAIHRLEISLQAIDIIGGGIEELGIDPSDCYDPDLLECVDQVDHAMSQPTTSMA